MSGPQLTVIVPPELADGYRLAGVHTEPAGTIAAAAEALSRLLARRGPPGVVAVHAPYLRELGGRWQDRLDQPDRALVVALPEGRAGTDPAHAGESPQELLARAVGYELTFDPLGSAP